MENKNLKNDSSKNSKNNTKELDYNEGILLF